MFPKFTQVGLDSDTLYTRGGGLIFGKLIGLNI